VIQERHILYCLCVSHLTTTEAFEVLKSHVEFSVKSLIGHRTYFDVIAHVGGDEKKIHCFSLDTGQKRPEPPKVKIETKAGLQDSVSTVKSVDSTGTTGSGGNSPSKKKKIGFLVPAVKKHMSELKDFLDGLTITKVGGMASNAALIKAPLDFYFRWTLTMTLNLTLMLPEGCL